jgi:hypothetical protein
MTQTQKTPIDPCNSPCGLWRPVNDGSGCHCQVKPSACCNGDDINCSHFAANDSYHARILDHTYEESLLDWREVRLEKASKVAFLFTRHDRPPRVCR